MISYIRVSTKGQEKSGLGLEAQQELVERYRASVDGKIVAEFREIESGRKDDRPKLAKALAHAKLVKGTLVIAKLDRLARDVHFISGLMKKDVPFVDADSPNDDDLMRHVKASFGQEEAKKIRLRTKAALAALKARGVKLGSAREGAHRFQGGANPEASRKAGEVATADKIAAYSEIHIEVSKMRESGLSLQRIADHLNSEGLSTRRGKPWNRMQVSRVLDVSREYPAE